MHLPDGDQLTIDFMKKLFVTKCLGDVQLKNLHDNVEFHRSLHPTSYYNVPYGINIIRGIVQ